MLQQISWNILHWSSGTSVYTSHVYGPISRAWIPLHRCRQQEKKRGMIRSRWKQCRLGSRSGCRRYWSCWLREVRRCPLYMRSLRAYLPHTVVPEAPFGPASCIHTRLGSNRARQLSLKCYSPYLGKNQQVRPGVCVFETLLYFSIRSICEAVACFLSIVYGDILSSKSWPLARNRFEPEFEGLR
jgi:hypothetical protein